MSATMQTQQQPRKAWDAIAIGASAGGVDAIARLLEALPAHCRAAVFVVLHLAPDSRSVLAQLLARRCALPVKEAEDKELAQPGVVYLCVPDYHLMVEPDRTLALSRDEPVHYSRPSIDVLFESAALAYRDSLLGIILTGASRDGADGLKQVRACGGTAWVQDPSDAAAPTMPDAALAHAGADAVLPLEKIAARLATFCSQDAA
ncbi:MAG TPA: chemotaxis protein CheB [Noviherbaspirillum sp.]|nr:chemotaxis protein CheB [Noviherbaspirillum sp.]